MGKLFLRQKQVARIAIRPTESGNKAVFMVEAETAPERRQVRELFDTVAELADVTQLSDGQLMSFAVQLKGDTSLFSKIECLLKSQFSFSVVERSFSDLTYRLIENLCDESGSKISKLPRCGICDAADPFPTRVTMRDEEDNEVLEAAYCGPCASQQEDRDRKKMLIGLLAADRRNFAAIRQARLVRSRKKAEPTTGRSQEEVQTYAIAS